MYSSSMSDKVPFVDLRGWIQPRSHSSFYVIIGLSRPILIDETHRSIPHFSNDFLVVLNPCPEYQSNAEL